MKTTSTGKKEPAQEVYGRINQLERDVATVSTQLDSQAYQLQEIASAVRGLADRLHQPTNWFGVIAALSAIIASGVAFVRLQVAPVETTLVRSINTLDLLGTRFAEVDRENAGQHAMLSAKLDALEQFQERYDASVRRELDLVREYARTDRERIDDKIDALDEFGSRRRAQRPE